MKRNLTLPVSIDEELATRWIREAKAQNKLRDIMLEDILRDWFKDKPVRED